MTIACIFLVSPSALSEGAAPPPRGLGYGFFGSVTRPMQLTAGFGGEGYVSRNWAVGAEVGAVGLTAGENPRLGVGSADLSYHFFPKKLIGKAAPFVAGVYSLFFGHNSVEGGKDVATDGFNLGGGVDFFASKHWGARFAIRYHGHGSRILKYTYPDLDQFSFVGFRISLMSR